MERIRDRKGEGTREILRGLEHTQGEKPGSRPLASVSVDEELPI